MNCYLDPIRPLGPRQEELLSWFQGRAPVGEPVPFEIPAIMTDLNISAREMVHRVANGLWRRGFIDFVTKGNRGQWGTVRVVRRLEAS